MPKSQLRKNEFLELTVRNMEGDISKFPAHPKQPYVQSIDMLTDNGRCGTIREVMEYWGERLEGKEINHTEYTELNWMYAYSIAFSFLRGLSPETMNIYARDPNKRSPAEAYISLSELPRMTTNEITQLLQAQPIVTNRNNIIVDGIHRACAMIGRLIAGERYLPVYRDDFPALATLGANPNRMRFKI